MGHKKYLVVKGSGGGGLGDRIKSVLVAALYAKITKRILVVDWADGIYADDGINAFDHLLVLKNIQHQKTLPKSNDIWPRAWQSRLTKTMDNIYVEDGWLSWQREKVIEKYSFDLAKHDYQERVLVMWEFDQIEKLKPFFQQYAQDNISLYRYAFHEFLSVHSQVNDKMSNTLIAFSNNMLGMHIRATLEAKSSKGMIPVKNYLQLMRKLLKQGKIDGIFVATDNSVMQQRLLSEYPQLVSHEKWFAKPWESLHLNKQCPDLLENAQNALIDIILLSRCQYLCYNEQSSFGLTAHIMSIAEDGYVQILTPKVGIFKRIIKKFLKLY